MKMIEVIADAGHYDTIQGIADHHGVVDVWWGPQQDDGRRAARMLVRPEERQSVLDKLQGILSGAENARILVVPLEAVLPRRDGLGGWGVSGGATREELYDEIARGAQLNASFVLLVVLSTIVAAIGLIENNIAVVIGAMVIAPLLGPNLALALGTALGDLDLMWKSLKANVVGVSVAFILSVAIGALWPIGFLSDELLVRADVGLDSIALALASGAAAVLSLTTGVPTVLVGVMVAVALLPPTAATGIFLGSGHEAYAADAALLLAINVVCVNLAAKLVFLMRGVKPRSWLEKRKARQSMLIYILLWVVTLALLLLALWLRDPALLAP